MYDEIKDYIENNTSDFTIMYATKLIERLEILSNQETEDSDISKFILYKTLSSDLCFACELLLKAKLNKYTTNRHDIKDWKTHNLLVAFNELELNDKQEIANEIGISITRIEDILTDTNTSDAFIKRYLYESTTGIPNYPFLAKFSKALLKINNISKEYNIEGISLLPSDFDYSSFDYSELLKKHTKLIERKSAVFDLNDIHDAKEKYIVKNMKSCDYAFFSELRFKYFDKNSNPKKEHEFKDLHKRLDEACKFLVAKSRYMDKYMNKDSTIDFVWALESLMFLENFDVGDKLSELYGDLNITFERSRYCTVDYFDNYYSSHEFFKTIKSITDLLIMNKDKAEKILSNKNDLMDKYGINFLQIMEFMPSEMAQLDMDYLEQLANYVNLNYIPKTLILCSDINVRNKLFYFLENYHNYAIPCELDYIIEGQAGQYSFNKEKYVADMALEKSYLNTSKEKIDNYILLSKSIKEKELIMSIIENKLNFDISINRYNEIKQKCNQLQLSEEEQTEFFQIFEKNILQDETFKDINKLLVLYKQFHKEFARYDLKELINILDVPTNRLMLIYNVFKKNGLSSVFLGNEKDFYMKINFKELDSKLKEFKQNENTLQDSSYLKQREFYNTDVKELTEFLKESGIDYCINLALFNSEQAKSIRKILKDKKLLGLYRSSNFFETIQNDELFNNLLAKPLLNSPNKDNYSDENYQSIGNYIVNIYKNNKSKGIEKVLLDAMDLKIVLSNPSVLNIFNYPQDSLENIYKLNIYNSWYEKVSSNSITCNGSNITLNNDQINNILKLLANDLINDGQSCFSESRDKKEVTDRLNKLFSNPQLVYSMDEKIFKDYDIEYMNELTKNSKFKNKDFDNFNYFGNLFKFIEFHNLDKDKVLQLMNQLNNHKKSPEVIGFVKKVLDMQELDYAYGNVLVKRTYEDQNGQQKIDNDLIDNLTNMFKNSNVEQIKAYTQHAKVNIEEMDIINPTLIEEETTDNFIIRVGKEALQTMQNFIKGNGVRNIKNELVNKVSTSYLSNKIELALMKKDMSKLQEGERKSHAK